MDIQKHGIILNVERFDECVAFSRVGSPSSSVTAPAVSQYAAIDAKAWFWCRQSSKSIGGGIPAHSGRPASSYRPSRSDLPSNGDQVSDAGARR